MDAEDSTRPAGPIGDAHPLSGGSGGTLEGSPPGILEMGVGTVRQDREGPNPPESEASGEGEDGGTTQTDDGSPSGEPTGEDGETLHEPGDVQRGPAAESQGKYDPQRVVTAEEIAKALRLAKGKKPLAAQILGIPLSKLHARLSSSHKLRTCWNRTTRPSAPTELSVLNRNAPREIKEASVLGLAIQKQNNKMLRDGLRDAGIQESTLHKLNIFESFGQNSGAFLIASLDLTHKMMVFGNVTLFEEAEYIRAKYLQNETLSPELKLEWQKAYNEIIDIQGKNYERVLAGTQAMAKMQPKDDKKEKKRKPGFHPLIDVDARKD